MSADAAASLGIGALTIIPLLIALLFGLVQLRQARVVIEERTYRRITTETMLFASVALGWIVPVGVRATGAGCQDFWSDFLQYVVMAQATLMVMALTLLVLSVRELFGYIRKHARN